MLRKTFSQPHIDFGALLWYSTDILGLMGDVEGSLRSFTRKINSFKDMNYWQQLKLTGIHSFKKRIEQFKILILFIIQMTQGKRAPYLMNMKYGIIVKLDIFVKHHL